jgi:S1-C subfamily serine protease
MYSDVAVLTSKEALNIEALTLADSSNVRVGEPVIVIGNPLELPGTITSGIVSQTNRFVEIRYDSGTRWVANLIQFDAAVNFGNSGSPLLNSKGEVIGMVIGRVDPNLGDGIYYAVSLNKVKRVADSIITRGSFDYPWLGVEIANLTPETVRARGLKTTNGVLVKGVITNTPAGAAGIKVDDIIMGIRGMAVQGTADLTSYLGEYMSIDEVVTLEIIRDGAKLELSVKLGKRP